MLQYAYCNYYFDHFLPADVVEHRRYFSQKNRGFGEAAFHAMWFFLFEHFRPANALEIGVYRGQTITLWKLLSRSFGFTCEISAISPFSSSGDACSTYSSTIDYYKDTINNHQHFGLDLPRFCKEFSTAPAAESLIKSLPWSVIYIDGNHDYEVASHDWKLCSAAVALYGIIILDDSALNTDYRPPGFSTAGHPGPSKVAAEIDRNKFREIFSVGHNRVFQRIA
jgi:hypothetical protein